MASSTKAPQFQIFDGDLLTDHQEVTTQVTTSTAKLAKVVVTFDPLLVTGIAIICSLAVIAGIGVCIFVICYTHRRRVKKKAQRSWKKLSSKVAVMRMTSHRGIPTAVLADTNNASVGIVQAIAQHNRRSLHQAGQQARENPLEPSRSMSHQFFTVGRKWARAGSVSQIAAAPTEDLTEQNVVIHEFEVIAPAESRPTRLIHPVPGSRVFPTMDSFRRANEAEEKKEEDFGTTQTLHVAV